MARAPDAGRDPRACRRGLHGLLAAARGRTSAASTVSRLRRQRRHLEADLQPRAGDVERHHDARRLLRPADNRTRLPNGISGRRSLRRRSGRDGRRTSIKGKTSKGAAGRRRNGVDDRPWLSPTDTPSDGSGPAARRASRASEASTSSHDPRRETGDMSGALPAKRRPVGRRKIVRSGPASGRRPVCDCPMAALIAPEWPRASRARTLRRRPPTVEHREHSARAGDRAVVSAVTKRALGALPARGAAGSAKEHPPVSRRSRLRRASYRRRPDFQEAGLSRTL